ncbi:hypothetical protein DL98DRAFT_623227 [Cadophora sp. DSE1049]|nr:hypothetical protein DL98DRAFT_623227 [Cadophora sp. DSE1049]
MLLGAIDPYFDDSDDNDDDDDDEIDLTEEKALPRLHPEPPKIAPDPTHRSEDVNLEIQDVPDVMEDIRKTVLAALPMQKVSMKPGSPEYQGTFDLDRDPLAFLKEQKYIESPAEALRKAITLTGSPGDAQAITTTEYLSKVWPESGQNVLAEVAHAEASEDVTKHTTVVSDGVPESYVDSGYETHSLAGVLSNHPIQEEIGNLGHGGNDDGGTECSDIASLVDSDKEDYVSKIVDDLIDKLLHDNTQGQPSRSPDEPAMERIARKLEILLKAFALKVGHSSHDGATAQINRDVMAFVYKHRQ